MAADRAGGGSRRSATSSRPTCPGVEIELDEYGGDLDGLLVAEVEFPGENEAHAFTPPPWFGLDVTDDRRFKNQRLAVDGRPA